MDVALYDLEDGFFARGRGAGRSGRDFVTAPEIGPLFGACVARALDRWWRAAGAPDPFLVVEPGAGVGRLAREVLRAQPDCLRALRYVLVERSPALRADQRNLLQLEPADEALGPFTQRAVDDELRPVSSAGPVFASVETLPEMPVDTMVFANELLDNLPVGIAHWDGSRWQEVRVAMDGDRFVEILVPAAEVDAAQLTQTVGQSDLHVGTRLPIPRGLDMWLEECGRALHNGVVVLIDYIVDIGVAVSRSPEWLRTFRQHERGDDPLRDPGSQDITADIVRSQLERAARTAGFQLVEDQTQAAWLHDLGLEALVESGRRTWQAGAHRGDLHAIAGRSLGNEAAALTDPAGLGAHRVVMLTKQPGTTPSGSTANEHR
jgi:SAM-dependent MidA family methyltransferase